MRPFSRFLLRGAAALALALSGLCAHAISFTPIEMDFSPAGRGATQVFRLENTTPEPAAVEITVKARAMAANGDDVLTDAEDQFNVFPAQVVLQPGQVQTVRVQYVGTSAIEREQAYRLIAEQLPVDVGQVAQNGGRMRLLVKYVASVYVVPGNVKAVLKVGETRLVAEGDKRWLQVSVTNEGGTRKILKGVKLQVAGMTLSGDQLKGMEGENLLAGTTRVFRVAAPAGLDAVSAPARLILE
ncbi:MAG: molecular chaperone [Ramlibacter sp.]|nr:molecular chaperone [Ramlibacter sp.]